MAIYSMKCPHCHTENVAVSIVHSVRKGNNSNIFVAFGVCQFCFGGVCVEFAPATGINHAPENCPNLSNSYRTIKIYPIYVEDKCPKFCPDNIVKFYQQAVDCLNRKSYDAAGMMFRKTIDTTTKKLGSDSSQNLKKRIDWLRDNQKITADMAEWAHQIRIDGNDAAHEDEPFTQEAAEALKGFTELLLMYVFTLPGMLAERKAVPTSSPMEKSK